MTDNRVRAYLEMVLVQPSTNESEHSGLVVVRDPSKDEVQVGVITDVGPDVPQLQDGDEVYFATWYTIPDSTDVAVHFSDVVAYKRLYTEE